MKHLLLRLDKLLAALIAVVFFTPLCLTVFFCCWTTPLPHTEWLRNETLVGMKASEAHVPLSWSTVRSGSYQSAAAARFNENFAGRELLIRSTCETWYRLFKRSPLSSIAISLGRDDFVFQDYYLQEYCLTRTSAEQLEPLVRDMRRLQDACEHFGVAFLLLITPSKAAIMPEYIPPAWLRRYDLRPRAYHQLVPLLTKHGIHFVDGHALTAQAKAHAPAPIFPKGGIHWGEYGAWVTTNALVAALEAQGKSLKSIQHFLPYVTDEPEGEDADVVSLMNLVVPWRYPVARMKIEGSPGFPGRPLNATIIGGSFATQVARQLSACGQFSEVEIFNYYKKFKWSVVDGIINLARMPVNEVDFDREILATDCLVLEANEAALAIKGPHHLITFVDDALKHIANGLPARRDFLYEHRISYLPYQWGQELSFRARDTSFSAHQDCLTGFSGFEELAAWTKGPVATVRLSTPTATRDLLLEAEVIALLHPEKLPVQHAKVFVNGHPIGEWHFADGERARRKLVIPKEALDESGMLVLRFEIARPVTPASLGMGNDFRALGLLFSTLKLSEASPQPD